MPDFAVTLRSFMVEEKEEIEEKRAFALGISTEDE